MSQASFRPLVIGAPRSGFALLASVVIHFVPFAPSKINLRQAVLDALVRGIGDHISDEIVREFANAGISSDLLYNPNFRYILGGPKWLSRERDGYACFRKYIGVRGMGDFTLITSHPREVLDVDEIVHSHNDPGWWLEHAAYRDYTKYASCRNPIGILNSSVFSLNALASEYIQKFVPAERDNDLIRQELALYKFTDLDFFEGLVRFLSGYLKEFVEFKDRYILMKWEDLILNPVPTIMRLAAQSGIPISDDYAQEIWRKLDHVNLTQAHKHNYRVGKGIVGDWKNWVVNEHLELVKNHGIEPYMIELGYGPIEYLSESDYTPFQRRVKGYLARGEIHREFFDPDLFTFAFNKSNLISDRFPFKRYGWREWTQIERSIFQNEALQKRVWDVAETATGKINALIEDLLAGDYSNSAAAIKHIMALKIRHATGLGEPNPDRYVHAFNAAIAAASFSTQPPQTLSSPPTIADSDPQLVGSEGNYNIVAFRNAYYGLPQNLGDIHLEHDDVSTNPKVYVEHTEEAVRERIRTAARP